MQRVMIIGCCGAGKSTLSKKLSELTGLETIHLDQHYWKPNWVETNAEEWNTIVQKLAARPSWIIDGNYGGTMDLRIEKADTIIYLDYSTVKCLWRITKRIVKYKGRERPDMPTGCKERFDLEFYHYVATYNLLRRKKLHQLVNRVKGEKQVFIFRNDGEVDDFLEGLKSRGY